MSEVKWYCRGAAGEYVLDVVESLADGMIDEDRFIAKLSQFGLSPQEIMDVFAEDVLGV